MWCVYDGGVCGVMWGVVCDVCGVWCVWIEYCVWVCCM